jgi:broad-specificity NMP kinase
MKRLILVNGTMGVGKTAVCNELLNILQPSVFLDGDWCWNMKPFIVNDETKNMVQNNIIYLLRSFLTCSEYENVIFCWVMHKENIIYDLLEQLTDIEFEKYIFTLTISKEALIKRLSNDIDNNIRTSDVIERSLARLDVYNQMNTIKIDVSNITPKQAAEEMVTLLK